MISSALLAKYDVPVPRYTSYPTVPHWTDALGADTWLNSLTAGIAAPTASLALYVHLPFCESLCTFCGCNTVITRDHSREPGYLELILQELDTYIARVPGSAAVPVTQLHLGGGTPTFFAAEQLTQLVDGIGRRLQVPTESKVFDASIEADPRVTTAHQLAALRARGFSRVSFGVQDIDAEVQRLVNRRQPLELTTTLCRTARALGYASINLDFIYGLPGQTPETMRAVAESILDLQPDRVALYSFARVPWIKPAQRKFRDDQVPVGAKKRVLYEIVRDAVVREGYVEIGLDHFARPEDSLARAARAGGLSRNFMGYTDHRSTVLVGLGVSAISETHDCYHQNEKVLPLYERRVRACEIPSLRGVHLSGTDQRQRAIITALLTTYRAEIRTADVTAPGDLQQLIEDGLVQLRGQELTVLDAGIPFLRNIARCFDARHHAAAPSAMPVHSRL